VPFIFLAGLINIAIELANISEVVPFTQAGGMLGTIVILLAGIPLYFCGGAEILLVRPFVMHGLVGLGTAVGFSVTSTAICIASAAMLVKIMGARATLLMASLILLISFALATLANMVI
jgi:uncharacterized membrane protein YraQ (UPF0718 family)